jgi:hypothetical protein
MEELVDASPTLPIALWFRVLQNSEIPRDGLSKLMVHLPQIFIRDRILPKTTFQ